jgi:hypothetical protein
VSGIAMFDTAYNNQFPAGAAAYAAYADGGVGNQPNFNFIVAAFPQARHLSIALFAANDADALDVESGAAEPADIPGWHARQVARGIARPVIYANVYTMSAEVLPVLSAAGIARAAVRLWTAHYGFGEHACGPGSCRELSIAADGTQWTSAAMGRTLDQSLLADDFFGTAPAPGVPAWQEAIMQALPTVREGSTGGIVKTIQGLCCARGHVTPIDGDFGAGTLQQVKATQAAAGVTQDGIVGPATWAALVGVA